MYPPSLLSLEVKVTNWKVLEVPNVNTTCEHILDKFTDCEVVFTACKNAALVRYDCKLQNILVTRKERRASNCDKDGKIILFKTCVCLRYAL